MVTPASRIGPDCQQASDVAARHRGRPAAGYAASWLLLFAATHLANHALGLVSLEAAEAGRAVFLAFWRLPAVEATLAAALLVHAALGLWKLWQRRTSAHAAGGGGAARAGRS